MESERIRVRRYFEDFRELLDFEWNFTADEFEIFKAFFETDLCNGESPFEITTIDPDDSNSQSVTDYGFFEAQYQWSYSDSVYNVTATVIIEEELIEQITEPFDGDACDIVIWPTVSDGSGGGNTFDCYTAASYLITEFPAAGIGLTFYYKGDSPFGMKGEPFEIYSDGNLVLGSTSEGSELNVMYYGDSERGAQGDFFEDYAAGSFTEATALGASTTGLDDFFLKI
jgi:hypothetical protein